MSKFSDQELGMTRRITRRDFLDGMAVAIGTSLLPRNLLGADRSPEPQNLTGYNPPLRTGMRGSHAGAFETAHRLRDGSFWDNAPAVIDTQESYDLLVVGGGISGLSAAHFFREQAGPQARILILDNHDDFGGHAKRNEFHLGGGLQLMHGGTFNIDSPFPYSAEADGLLRKLGINVPQLTKTTNDAHFYESLGLRPSVFFNQETFGADKLLVGEPLRHSAAEPTDPPKAPAPSWGKFLAGSPLSPAVQRDIVRIEEARIDYLPGLTSAEKKDRLSRISYRDFLLNVVKADPGVIPFYQTLTNGEWGAGIDAEPALDCWAMGLPGFQGMNLAPGAAPRMSYTAAGYAGGGSYFLHLPDGNATIARLLVRQLIPDAVPGNSLDDVIPAQVDYSKLDRDNAPVRIRLNSTAVRVRHVGDIASAKETQVTYADGSGVYSVRAKSVILACWATSIPYLVPDLPERQKQALHYLVKVPLVYTTVGLRNWKAFHKLGTHSVYSPGCYHFGIGLNPRVKFGNFSTASTPDEPMLVHMYRTPCKPGLPVREQHKAGRWELLATSFEIFERNIRDQLARTLQAGGFDPARDIEAITVNRWAHGYGYEYNPLFDPEWPEQERPNVIGRQRFGRVAIANTDAAATAYTDSAINEAFRAVRELLASA